MTQHIAISGTGRAGTTFLMQLFTALGFDTGFSDYQAAINLNCNAGMEFDLNSENLPFIIKSPFLCDELEKFINEKKICIKYLIVPIRDLYSAAESRRKIQKEGKNFNFSSSENIPGGLWGTKDPEMQEQFLMKMFYKLIFLSVKYDLKIIFLDFPKIINDPEYLRQKLLPLFKFSMRFKLRKKKFHRIYSLVCKPELLHNFDLKKEKII
jgi:hypothetical protein